MKNIHESLLDMDKFTKKQLAATLDDNEKKELLSMLDSITEQSSNTVECSTSNIVNFENCISIPNGITVLPQAREFVYDSCLTCVKGDATIVTINPPNCPPINASLYPIKIIGCIQYIAIADVNFASDICYIKTSNNTSTVQSICPSAPPIPTDTSGISVTGSVCVNTIVGFTANTPDCSSSIPCNVISVCLDSFTVDKNGRLLISGKFILPTITDCGTIPPCSKTSCISSN